MTIGELRMMEEMVPERLKTVERKTAKKMGELN